MTFCGWMIRIFVTIMMFGSNRLLCAYVHIYRFAYFFWCFAASFITWWWWRLGGDLLFACLHVSIAAFLTILMFCWNCYYMVMIVFKFACFFCSQDHDVLLRRSVITCWRLRCLFESIYFLHFPFAAFVIIMMFCWKCYYMVHLRGSSVIALPNISTGLTSSHHHSLITTIIMLLFLMMMMMTMVVMMMVMIWPPHIITLWP